MSFFPLSMINNMPDSGGGAAGKTTEVSSPAGDICLHTFDLFLSPPDSMHYTHTNPRYHS